MEMEKFDYKKVLKNGKVYECMRSKNGRICLFYDEKGIKRMYAFDDIMHEWCLSKQSHFITPEQIILEVTSIDFINFDAGYVYFSGRVKFGGVISTESVENIKNII
jgi:hypothetical protein